MLSAAGVTLDDLASAATQAARADALFHAGAFPSRTDAQEFVAALATLAAGGSISPAMLDWLRANAALAKGAQEVAALRLTAYEAEVARNRLLRTIGVLRRDRDKEAQWLAAVDASLATLEEEYTPGQAHSLPQALNIGLAYITRKESARIMRNAIARLDRDLADAEAKLATMVNPAPGFAG